MIALSGSSPRIDIAETDLPLPDSPTRATMRCVGTSKEMPFTASKVVCLSIRKETRRSWTCRRFWSLAMLVVPGVT